MIFTDADKAVIREVYANLRQRPPEPSAESKKVMSKARGAIAALAKKPPTHAHELDSPQLLVALHALLGPLLKQQVRLGRPRKAVASVFGIPTAGSAVPAPTDELAELAVALYLAYELVNEIKTHSGDDEHHA